jgi:hypothetical protein
MEDPSEDRFFDQGCEDRDPDQDLTDCVDPVERGETRIGELGPEVIPGEHYQSDHRHDRDGGPTPEQGLDDIATPDPDLLEAEDVTGA